MTDDPLRAALDETDALPEDAPVMGVGGQMYEAGWRERRQAIEDALAASATDGLDEHVHTAACHSENCLGRDHD